ncbi:MAG: ThiF family adenylyltransferase [Fimbriimonadia bacterium]|nr:ThiF family adenylyltransferase [Fimbriimonadia bacterium]
MTCRLRVPLSLFQDWLDRLAEDPSSVVAVPMSFVSEVSGTPICVVRQPSEERNSSAVLLVFGDPGVPESLSGWSNPPALRGFLWIGLGAHRGQISGVVLCHDARFRVEALDLVGPGMRRLPVLDTDRPSFADPRLSRTVGALGQATVNRVRSLAVLQIGCGRNGSLLALNLARLGVEQLTLVDPDLVEEHNLGEMEGVFESDVGLPKAVALARHLRLVNRAGAVQTISEGASHADCVAAARECDLVVSCVDNDPARLAAAILATIFCVPHLDVGTGVFLSEGARLAGADVRLISPGDGCLLEWGGLARREEAVRILSGLQAAPTADWQSERMGSLRSLNEMAVGLAVQMLLDFVSGAIQGSFWQQLELSPQGRASIAHPAPNRDPACRLCASLGKADL